MIQGLMPAKGDLIDVSVESAAFEGAAVGRVEGMVVFLPFAVPGDRVRARIYRKRRRYAEAAVEEILEPSPFRIEPRCRYFGECGGCRHQNVLYSKQMEAKRDQVTELLERIGKLVSPPVLPTLGSPEPYFYRNKMEFSFGCNRWLTRDEIETGREFRKDFALGLHVPGRYDKILDLEECYLQSDFTARLVNRVRRLALSKGWTPYDTVRNSGYLRNLVIRTGVNTGDVMVILVTTTEDRQRMEKVVDAVVSELPSVTTIVNSMNPGRSPVASGEEIVSYGPGCIHERLGKLTYRVTPTAFFQPNTKQAEKLMETISKLCRETTQPRVLYDLFCGLGTIGLTLAGYFETVIGVENHEESIRLARLNAEMNGITNARFFHSDAGEAVKPDFIERHQRPDLLILDPPRAGLHPELVRGILTLQPPRMVYTSCNPATLARDLRLLSVSFEVESVQPVDMFPQTYHIETVTALRLKR